MVGVDELCTMLKPEVGPTNEPSQIKEIARVENANVKNDTSVVLSRAEIRCRKSNCEKDGSTVKGIIEWGEIPPDDGTTILEVSRPVEEGTMRALEDEVEGPDRMGNIPAVEEGRGSGNEVELRPGT